MTADPEAELCGGGEGLTAKGAGEFFWALQIVIQAAEDLDTLTIRGGSVLDAPGVLASAHKDPGGCVGTVFRQEGLCKVSGPIEKLCGRREASLQQAVVECFDITDFSRASVPRFGDGLRQGVWGCVSGEVVEEPIHIILRPLLK